MDRHTQQVDLVDLTIPTIMRRAKFKAGVEDVRGGMPGRFDKFADDPFWAYERGRQFATVAPRSMAIKIGGKLNPKAVALYVVAAERGLII